MFKRLLNPLNTSSFFIFGARGVGKSTFIAQNYRSNVFKIDLLIPDMESKYILHPQSLKEELDALSHKPEWVVIDEIQRAPKLLDVVHSLIESKHKYKFVLTKRFCPSLIPKGK